MAHALCAWAINRGGKTSVRDLWYGPRTRLVRGIDVTISYHMIQTNYSFVKCTVYQHLESLRTKMFMSYLNFKIIFHHI